MRTLLLFCIPLSLLSAQQIQVERAEAEEEFRWGVQAYHSAQYGEAILSFSRALALSPDYVDARRWLADAYLASGFRAAAVDEWKTVNAIEPSVTLSYLIAFFESQQSRLFEERLADEYYEAAALKGVQDETQFFFRPAMLRARADGSFYLASMETHEVLRISAGGTVLKRFAGGLSSFNRPFDVVEQDGVLFVSEFGGNRISRITVEGESVSAFGNFGSAEGEFIGPQYLSLDDEGYLYVSDYGNKRISKFDSDGRFILQFGERTTRFAGLIRPKGIAFANDTLFVVDRSRIETFDRNGNYLGGYPAPEQNGEALRHIEGSSFLLSAPGRVVIFDLETGFEIASFADEGAAHLLGVERDVNGTILVSDNEKNSLRYFFPYSRINSGFFLWIEKIRFTAFPRVVVELSVRDWDGRPISGLDKGNFSLFENNVYIPDLSLHSSQGFSQGSDVVLLFESSPRALEHRATLDDAINTVKRELRSYQDEDSMFRIITSGGQPVMLATSNTQRNFEVDASVFTENWNFEKGVSLAASSLLTGTETRRSIVFLSHGQVSSAQQQLDLERLGHYLSQNRIRFDVLLLHSDDRLSDELEYLVDKTGGEVHYVYQAAGIDPLLESISRSPSGHYVLEYESDMDGDFGRRYIPLSVEANYFVRSGRIESGYFAPLEF